ncbi:unnamed protein product [Rotaria magnacalcarata]|nr:unnamed protein product [Rotaria magnacalcarata]CAF2084772.1 unnamed protein product [Rotaria magnacalcarata]CAF3832186.1 unnamed protein product [Rotaria magnacalcarata]
MMMPIQGYGNKPLVSLEEAVKPITNLVNNIERMVWVAKQHQCDTPTDDLTVDQSASILLYSMEWEPVENSFYQVLNNVLRSEARNSIKPWFSYLKLFVTALNKVPHFQGIAYRGVNGNLSGSYPIGKTFVWWGFSSCSSSLGIIEGALQTGEQTIFVIQCINGRDIRQHSFFQSEYEILLLAGAQLRVVATFKPSENVNIIQLEETKPPFALLEIPTIESSSRARSSHKAVFFHEHMGRVST